MKLIVLTVPGLEGYALEEAKERLKQCVVVSKGALIADFENLEEALAFCYMSQSASRVGLVIEELGSDESFEGLKEWVGESFSIQAFRSPEENGMGYQEAQALAQKISKKTGSKLDYKNPQTPLFTYSFKGKVLLCLDLAGHDLGRRDYRIFLKAQALQGNLAYLLVRSVWGKGAKLLDPFCRDGIIPIEAALWAKNQSPNFFSKEKMAFTKHPKLEKFDWKDFFSKLDNEAKETGSKEIIAMDSSFANVQSAKKNAKIAGVLKEISFSRLELEWLDTRFEKNSLGSIVSFPPQPSKSIPEKSTRRICSIFFHQANWVLEDKGKVALLIQRGEEVFREEAEKEGFIVSNEVEIWRGKERLKELIFEKSRT